MTRFRRAPFSSYQVAGSQRAGAVKGDRAQASLDGSGPLCERERRGKGGAYLAARFSAR